LFSIVCSLKIDCVCKKERRIEQRDWTKFTNHILKKLGENAEKEIYKYKTFEQVGSVETVFIKKAPERFEKYFFGEERSHNALRSGVADTLPHYKERRRVNDHFHSCDEDNGLELGRVSRRRVKIGLRLAGSHYNNYGGADGKLHASIPLTVSPG